MSIVQGWSAAHLVVGHDVVQLEELVHYLITRDPHRCKHDLSAEASPEVSGK